MKTSVWIASVAWDYPGAENDDTKLPISDVWFRIGYGPNWLGCAEVQRLQKIYEDQGIGFNGVFVPTRSNWGDQLANARAALQYVRGLQFDVEPYGAYLGSEAGIDEWLDKVLVPLAASDQSKELSLCYDPRPQWLDGWGFAQAVALVDSLAPMVYTRMYRGQGVWGDPLKAIDEARAQCPSNKLFRPILQTYQIEPIETFDSFVRTVQVGGLPQLFRRGVTPAATWSAIAALDQARIPPAEEGEEQDQMSSAEFERAMQAVEEVRKMSDGRLDQIEADVRALGERVDAAPAPAPTSTPAPRPRSHTVKAGDTAGAIAGSNGLTIYQERGVWKGTFVALNPGKPRSGNWNLIYPGEKFRVA